MEDKYLNTKNIEVVTAAQLYPVIKSFFENLTPMQWHTIRSGDLDIATKSLLGELIVEITEIALKHFQMMTQNANTEISEDSVLSKMRTIVPQAFAQALGTVPQDNKASTEKLEQLLAKEVVLSIKSSQSSDSKTSFEEHKRTIPPKRLNKMIRFAGRMIRGLISKMNYYSTSTDTSSFSDSEEETKLLDSPSVSKEYLDQGYKRPAMGSQDSFYSEFLKTVKFHIKKAADKFFPILHKTRSPHYNKEQSRTTEEIELLAKELTHLVEAKVQCSVEPGEVITSTSFVEKCKQSLQNNAGKLKTFFAKQFAKSTIVRIAKKTRAKFQRKEKVESSESVEEIVNDVDLLLQTVNDCSSNELELFNQISMGKSLEFTQALTDMLNKYAVGGMAAETLPDCFRTAHVKLQVKVFLALMRWWLSTQAESHSDGVMLAILGTETTAEAQTSERISVVTSQPKSEPFVLDDPVRKAYIKMVLHKLFSRIAKKLKIKVTCVCTPKIHTWLLEEVWGEIRDKKLTITPQNLKNVEKYILRDLRNFFGSVEYVQVALELQKSTAVKTITRSLTEHLSDAKKKPNGIVRFFTALAKAITKPFRRTT